MQGKVLGTKQALHFLASEELAFSKRDKAGI